MAKRSATSELNHDNWNSKEEKEDPGNFTPLSGSELQKRVIRKAKRSINNPATSTSPMASSSPFAKFSGFSSTATTTSFFSSLNKTNSPLLAASSTTENASTAANSPFLISQENPISKVSIGSFFAASKKDAEKTSNGSPEDVVVIKSEGDTDAKTSDSSPSTAQGKQLRGLEYCKRLKSLNESVFKWMQLHLEKNVCCDFTPVFNDYKKHMDSLNVTYPVRKLEATTLQKNTSADVFKRPSPSADHHSDSMAQSKSQSETKQQQDETDYGAHFSSNTTNTSTFSFGIKLTPTATSSNSPLGPASSSTQNKQDNKDENKGTSQFSAGFFSKAYQPSTDKPFSFATAPIQKSETDKDDEYVPPKNDFVAVSEEDALYSKRCKLFFKKDGNFTEKGVGTLYLKSLEEKTQLLVRADTSLGNILLNIRLSSSLPISRVGKNNVLLVCVPHPPVDVKNPDSKEATPLLIRVKTSEEADELLETLNKYKS